MMNARQSQGRRWKLIGHFWAIGFLFLEGFFPILYFHLKLVKSWQPEEVAQFILIYLILVTLLPPGWQTQSLQTICCCRVGSGFSQSQQAALVCWSFCDLWWRTQDTSTCCFLDASDYDCPISTALLASVCLQLFPNVLYWQVNRMCNRSS